MWRFNWRAFCRQWNCQVRSAQQSVCRDEERCVENIDREHQHHHQWCHASGGVVPRRSVHTQANGNRYGQEDKGNHHDDHYGNGCEWAEWARTFRSEFLQPCSPLEAVGWGTCVVLGLHLNQLWRHVSQRETRGHHPGRVPGCFYSMVLSMPAPQGLMRSIRETGSSVVAGTSSASLQLGDESKHSVPYDDTGWKDQATILLLPRFTFAHQSIQLYNAPKDSWPACEMKAEDDTDALSPPERNAEELHELHSLCRAMIETGQGVKHVERGNYSKAIENWEAASANVSALFNLGVAYQTGKGVPVNLLKAAEHYHQGSLLGHSKSQYNLAMLYLTGREGVPKDTKRAVRLLQRAARAGLPQAQTQLGVLYTEDERQDMKRAANWFQVAARQNDTDAQYYLGVCFENGWGVTQDQVKARRWYEQAANAGHMQAVYNLAVFHEHGMGGLSRDVSRARTLYQEAAMAGDRKAKDALLRLTSQALDDLTQGSGVNFCMRVSSLEQTQSSASSPSLSDYMRQSLANLDLDFELEPVNSEIDYESTADSVQFTLGDFDDDTSDISIEFDPNYDLEQSGTGINRFHGETVPDFTGVNVFTFGSQNELLNVPTVKHSQSAHELRMSTF